MKVHSACGRGVATAGAPTLAPVRRYRDGAIWLTLIPLLLALVLAGCDPEGEGKGKVKYKPALLPVALTVGPDGVAVEGETSIVTPIGEFSIGAEYSLPPRDGSTIYVLLRDTKKGATGFDRVFKVQTGRDQLTVVVNGTTTIQVKDGQVLIDVTGGAVKKIQFKRVNQANVKEGGDSYWSSLGAKWSRGWDSSLYKPFVFTRWAYDDSTIDKWCGLGFVWFLLRLALTLVLLLLDLVLSSIFLLAQIAYLIFGSTGRNVVWGIAILLAVVAVIRGFLYY
ncbi:hypothetical protein GA0070561_4119 [Micromonospora saelicesensis]|uniref:Uncharacterized protein n=1 Tax=Micromonospora saelicesensis TaxID=285676 RepID=A0A1C4YE75_9ACTN|nr:hypothetical protein GA0070561_4119 [Micromonospora saelicesensis]